MVQNRHVGEQKKKYLDKTNRELTSFKMAGDSLCLSVLFRCVSRFPAWYFAQRD